MDSGAVNFFVGFTVCIGFGVVFAELVIMCFVSLFSRKEKEMFKDQIEAGAKLLDEKKPDWVDLMDLEELDLESTCNCVVGQSCPDKLYVKALESLFDMESDDWGDNIIQKSREYGFSVEDWKKYPDLTEEWKAYIEERRSQKTTIEQVP